MLKCKDMDHVYANPAALPMRGVKLDRTAVCISSCKQ